MLYVEQKKTMSEGKNQWGRLCISILCTILHYSAAILLSYTCAWICYQGTVTVGSTIVVFFPIPFPVDILMVSPLFYPLGLVFAVLGYILLFKLHRKIIKYLQPAKTRGYNAECIIILVLACILSIGASILAYLNTIFPQGGLKYELFFAGICTTIIPIMMVILFVRDKKYL